MILTNEFAVDAPVESTWRTLLDLERVAGCLPGASIEPAGEDGIYRGTLAMKLGPVRMSYNGTVQLQDVDDDTHTMSFHAAAREKGGVGTASARIRTRVEPNGGAGTQVNVETDLNVTGRAAQFGRGLMEGVATKMLSSFADGLREVITDGGSDRSLPGDGVADAIQNGSGQTDRARPSSPRAGDEDDVLDLGSGAISLLSSTRVAVLGGTALAAGLALLVARRGRRREIELTFTLRLR